MQLAGRQNLCNFSAIYFYFQNFLLFSRAHTIVTISLVQKYKNASGKEMAKSSLINLVDLAGR